VVEVSEAEDLAAEAEEDNPIHYYIPMLC
jgi:hypothetical protein